MVYPPLIKTTPPPQHDVQNRDRFRKQSDETMRERGWAKTSQTAIKILFYHRYSIIYYRIANTMATGRTQVLKY